MSFHKDAVGQDIHVPHAFTYVDEAARTAAVSDDFTNPDDLYKIARQDSDLTYWALEQIIPSVVWNQFGGGGGAIPTQDEGSNVVISPTAHNFVGAGVDVTDIGGISTITIPGLSGIPVGSVFVSGNTNETIISTISTWTDLDLGTAILGSNTFGWSLSDSVTGELTYTIVNPFPLGTLFASISASSSGASREFHFRAVKNGIVLPDPVETVVEIGVNSASAPLVVPVSVVNGDTIRLQVENVDGTTNIVISYLSLGIR